MAKNTPAKTRVTLDNVKPEVRHISHTCCTELLRLLKNVLAGVNMHRTSNMLFTFLVEILL